MAIYHFSVQVATRGAGKSAVAMAAYRSGERLIDERTGEIKNYPREVDPETLIMAPKDSPDWVYDRNRLWNEVEMAEKRKDSQLCREINVALPVELTHDQQRELLTNYIQDQFVNRGMIADVAIHRDHPENPHAHIMLTMRDISPEGFGKKNRDWNPSFANTRQSTLGFVKAAENTVDWRAAWADHTNKALEQIQSPARVDHRSLAAQGITDRVPTIHEGPTAREMDRKGKNSDRGSINRAVKEHNATVTDLRKYAAAKKQIQTEIQKAKTPEEIRAAYEQMYQRKMDSTGQLGRAEALLQKIGQLKELLKDREQMVRKLEELKPKNLWQKMRKTNENEVVALERDLDRLDSRIGVLQKDIPEQYQGKNAGKAESQLKEHVSELQGAHKAIEKALHGLDQERQRLHQEQMQQRFRDQARAQRRSSSQDHDRER